MLFKLPESTLVRRQQSVKSTNTEGSDEYVSCDSGDSESENDDPKLKGTIIILTCAWLLQVK